MLEQIQEVLDIYVKNVNLGSPDNELELIEIFREKALVLNDQDDYVKDLDVQIETYIGRGIYVTGSSGFESSFANFRVTEIKKDDQGYVRAKVKAVKTILSQLNKGNVLTKLKKPKSAEITFSFRYDSFLNSTLITSLQGTIKGNDAKKSLAKKYISNEDHISISVLRGLSGSIGTSLVDNSEIQGFRDAPNTDYSTSIGLALTYRRGIAANLGKPSLYLVGGAQLAVVEVDTDISEFSRTFDSVLATRITDDQQMFHDTLAPSLNTIFTESEAQEQLNLTVINFNLGVEYRIISRQSAFIGLRVYADFLISGTGETTGIFESRNIPKSSDTEEFIFPDINNIPLAVLDEYTNDLIGGPAIRPTSNISFGLNPYLRYQRRITTQLGIEAGVEYRLGLTDYFTTVDTPSMEGLFENDSNSRTLSVQEDLLTANKTRNLGFFVGVVYFLN
jgi:hypothetical protein